MIEQKTFDFDERLLMSEGVSSTGNTRDILLSHFPYAVSVQKASLADDKNGTDYWVIMPPGHKLSVDTKVREKDWWKTHPKEDDVALETWSVLGKKVGWTRDTAKRTDYILFIWSDTGRWMLLPFPMLCHVFEANWQEWRAKYRTEKQKSKGRNDSRWESECVYVPRKLIWNEIYAAFGGRMSA